jgi:proton-dependent oligopeptide transporter, POT family
MVNPAADPTTEPETPHVSRSDGDDWFGHPRQLARLFTVEMWERFGYYGMRALLALYLANHFLFDDQTTNAVYGAFTSLAYLTPLVGGWVADRYLGSKRSVKLGALLMAIGYFTLCFGGEPARPFAVIDGQRYAVHVEGEGHARTQYLVDGRQQLRILGREDGSVALLAPDRHLVKIVPKGHFSPGGHRSPFYSWLMIFALSILVVGNGFFKPNISTIVGTLYGPGDRRRDAGFTIFYMGINLGGFIAPIVCGSLAQSEWFRRWLAAEGFDPGHSWRWGFGAAGVGMLCGLALYLAFRDRYLPGIGLPPVRRTPTARGAVAREPLTPAERGRVIALFITFIFSIVFWMAFEQAGSSLNLFADRYTDLHLGSVTIPSSWLQSVQPLGILLFAPVFAALWQGLGARGREPSTPLKMALGLACMGIGFAVMVAAGHRVDACIAARGPAACAIVSPLWLITCYLFAVFGELCLSPVGLSYVTKLAPVRYASVLMGTWFLATAGGEKLAGELAALGTRIPSLATFFAIPVVASFGAALILALLVPVLNRLTAATAE